jgi:hypothetical protein
VIGDVDDARKLMIDWLAKASAVLRKGEDAAPRGMNLLSMVKADRESLVRTLEQFESRWQRSLGEDTQKGTSTKIPSGFQGLALADGLEFLIAGGLLYYDVQAMLVQFARNTMMSKKPQWRVMVIELKGFANVPVCDICAGLVKGIRGAQLEVTKQTEQQVVETPAQKTPRQPEAVAPIAPQVILKKKAREAVAEPTPDASPQFVEIMQKIGAATVEGEENAAKPRYGLHDHRLKEQWDEIAEKNAGEA